MYMSKAHVDKMLKSIHSCVTQAQLRSCAEWVSKIRLTYPMEFYYFIQILEARSMVIILRSHLSEPDTVNPKVEA